MIARCSVAGSLLAAAVVAAQLKPTAVATVDLVEGRATPAPSLARQAAEQLLELQAERLQTARCVAESYRARYRRGEVSLPELVAKEAAVLDAEFHLACCKPERLAIRKRQLELAKQQWRCMTQQVEAGAAPKAGADESRVAVLDAEIALLCERTR